MIAIILLKYLIAHGGMLPKELLGFSEIQNYMAQDTINQYER